MMSLQDGSTVAWISLHEAINDSISVGLVFFPFWIFFSGYRDNTEESHVSPKSPDGAVHHKVYCCASRELSDGAFFHRRVDFDLSHVSVSAVLVISQHCDLDHEGADWLICPLKKEVSKTKTMATIYHRAGNNVHHLFLFIFDVHHLIHQRDVNPAAGLHHL